VKIPYTWSRDEAIELCLEALATGCVHGFSPNHDPDLLATDTSFAQNGNGELHMWRDWGLFEAHFSRWQAGRPWQCDFFMVQAHRMKKPPTWTTVRKELERLGYQLGPGEFTGPGADYHTVIASGSGACVDLEHDRLRGRVIKISVPVQPFLPRRERTPLAVRGGSTSPAIEAIVQNLRTIAGAVENSWPGWLEQWQPAPGDWAFYLAQLVGLHRDEPDRRDTWTAFGRWLLEQARAAAIWPADEWAWRWADYVLDRPGAVAGHEVTRVCLAALPMTPTEAASLPVDWRARTPEHVHRSRMTLALLRFAADGEIPPPPPPRPALAEWQPLLPRLASGAALFP
jgi:hypothetical protein